MAVYEYKCRNCEKVIEKSCYHLSRPGGIVCGNCGDIARLILSVSSFHLKGGNWASQGYGNKK